MIAKQLAVNLGALATYGLIATLAPQASAETPSTPLKIGLIGDFQSVYSDIAAPGMSKPPGWRSRNSVAPCSANRSS